MRAPVEWRVVPSCPDYAVSNEGGVRRETPTRGARVGLLLKPYVMNKGYLVVDMALGRHRSRTRRTVHSLVAEAFIGPRPDGCYVLHIDGSRTNNGAENLRYGTPSENNADTVRHGRLSCGAEHGAKVRAGRWENQTAEQAERQRVLNARASRCGGRFVKGYCDAVGSLK